MAPLWDLKVQLQQASQQLAEETQDGASQDTQATGLVICLPQVRTMQDRSLQTFSFKGHFEY